MNGKLIVLVALIAIASSQSIPGLSDAANLLELPNNGLSQLLNTLSDVISQLLDTVILLLVTLLRPLFIAEPIVVDVPGLGQVKGLEKKYESDPSNVFYSFKGIPYAEPTPRFNVSQKKQPWNGVHDGTIEGKVCPQFTGQIFYTGQISEDCLLLTVTTPVNPKNFTTPAPVLVFVHGGFYAIGSSRTAWYDPELLVQEGLVVVNLQYRLSIFGYVTDGNIIPKNLGLKDIRLALKWVKDNIAAFGGDPNKVTIHGESAGAMAVSAIYQSTRTRHLCDGIFMQSGNIITPFAMNKNPPLAFSRIVNSTRCAITALSTPQQQVDCLRQLSMAELSLNAGVLLITEDIMNAGVINGGVAALVMEDASDSEAIIIEKPVEQLFAGDIPKDKPILMTITSEEMFTFEGALNVLRGRSNAGLVPMGMAASDPNEVGKLIKIEYAGSEAEWDFVYQDVYTSYGSDVIFNFPSRLYAHAAAPNLNPNVGVYFMQFSDASVISLLNDGQSKVGHAGDLMHTWKIQAVTFDATRKLLYSEKDVKRRNQLNRLIANFVKYGNPTPAPELLLDNLYWPQVSDPNLMNYLDFTSDGLNVLQEPKNEHYQFWINTYANYGNPTIGL